METRPISFVSFQADTTYIFGMDTEGQIWYRMKPKEYSSYGYGANQTMSPKDKEKKDEELIWKPLEMMAQVKYDPLPEPRQITADEPMPVKVEKIEPETKMAPTGSENDPTKIICGRCETISEHKPNEIVNDVARFWCVICRGYATFSLTLNNWYMYGKTGIAQYIGKADSRHSMWKENLEYENDYEARFR